MPMQNDMRRNSVASMMCVLLGTAGAGVLGGCDAGRPSVSESAEQARYPGAGYLSGPASDAAGAATNLSSVEARHFEAYNSYRRMFDEGTNGNIEQGRGAVSYDRQHASGGMVAAPGAGPGGCVLTADVRDD